MESVHSKTLTPDRIMQIGMGFWGSKVLLTAVEMGLFTHLARGVRSGEELKAHFGLHARSAYDYLDALVALGFLEREGLRETAIYRNSADADLFLDAEKPTYVGGILEISETRIYGIWDDLKQGLQTGKPQSGLTDASQSIFDIVYADQDKLREFIRGMSGIQMANFGLFAHKFDFSKYKTHCDLGGSGGYLSMEIAKAQPHMQCTTFDLPMVSEVAKEIIDAAGMTNRVQIQEGDFFNDTLPSAEVITMGNILHDWDLEEKKFLMQRVYDALPEGGAFVVIENIIDDARKENAFGLLMSLNMLLETKGGFDFSAADFEEWGREIGFTDFQKIQLAGPASAVVAIK